MSLCSRSRVGIALGVSLVLLSGCSSSVNQQGEPSASEGPPSLQGFLDQARAGGASDEQIMILEHAVRTGEVTFGQTKEAIDASLRCFEAGGIRSTYFGAVTLSSGLEIPSYSHGPSAGQDGTEALNIADACLEEHSLYVEMAYQLQPSSIALEEAYFESRRPGILACLRDNGVAIDDDATRDEIERASIELLYGMTWEELEKAAREAQDSGGVLAISDEDGPLPPDCLFDPAAD